MPSKMTKPIFKTGQDVWVTMGQYEPERAFFYGYTELKNYAQIEFYNDSECETVLVKLDRLYPTKQEAEGNLCQTHLK